MAYRLVRHGYALISGVLSVAYRGAPQMYDFDTPLKGFSVLVSPSGVSLELRVQVKVS